VYRVWKEGGVPLYIVFDLTRSHILFSMLLPVFLLMHLMILYSRETRQFHGISLVSSYLLDISGNVRVERISAFGKNKHMSRRRGPLHRGGGGSRVKRWCFYRCGGNDA
jgi:hypothetical protein